jgi:hypothetical protein
MIDRSGKSGGRIIFELNKVIYDLINFEYKLISDSVHLLEQLYHSEFGFYQVSDQSG